MTARVSSAQYRGVALSSASRQALAQHMTHEELMARVLDLCAKLHLRTAHFPPVRDEYGNVFTPTRGDAAGFPDLVITCPRGVIFRELKTERDSLRPDQVLWQLALPPSVYGVWRPRDWLNRSILQELLQLAGRERGGAAQSVPLVRDARRSRIVGVAGRRG